MDGYKLRFVPLGGVVGVTKNMYLYELYQGDALKNILIVDCGIGFPQDKTLGVDFVIPDISYLKDKVDKIRAIVLSHGHEDHTSALPYHYRDLGSPPVFTGKLTSVFLKSKFKEVGGSVNVTQIDYNKEYKFGEFKVHFISMTHSIPDTMHIFIKTPVGNFYHGTDFKLDLTPPYGKPPDFFKITRLAQEGVLCLLSDCLGAETPGLTLSEGIVGETFENEMRTARGKFIMTTFSSNISRIRQCVEAATKFNRKIAFLGRSMRENTTLASEIAYLPLKYNQMLKEDQIMKTPPNRVCLIVAGSQGQYNSALSKLANNMNKFIKIKPGDKIVFSSDPIPGNESEVYSLIEELSLLGADVVYSDIQEQLHASGHGNQEDLKFLIRFTNPRYFIPIGGTVRHQRQYQRLIEDLGYPENSAYLLDEGETVWFTKTGLRRGEVIDTKQIYVDAYGIGDVGNVVLRDRKTLSAEGMLVVVLVIDKQARLVTRPKIISRGFIYEKKEEQMLGKAEGVIEKIMKPRGKLVNINNIKQEVAKNLEDFFYRERGRKPILIVDVIQL